ncbi:hypothetical protein BGZ61DRAFT_522144 [Ilyonectria robusta]|uniref:uncharacterized protein n=1 Tax=Ilyonectria robusta TaxID=1079257 RepID=UPI001E8E3807|nr:uncharacterized protein BGZ61DRAFT_522144 [Ilyonectria robusta]KAH8667816.1 hypothetical protein BGZ61DRAFT_522144 [Ilyonectria robusta]
MPKLARQIPPTNKLPDVKRVETGASSLAIHPAPPPAVCVPDVQPTPSVATSFRRPCALAIGGLQGTLFGGKALGVVGAEIDTGIHFANSSGYNPWMGFSIDISLGESDEEDGLGTSHPRFQDPGFGKTTTLAIAALGMRVTTGKVLASAPTHASIDNLAARLHSITTRVTERYNQGKPLKPRFPRMMVVCAYAEIDEYAAFMALVEDPGKGDLAGPRDVFGTRSAWKLPLSVAYWLLVCLGSPAVPQIRLDDSNDLRNLRDDIATRQDLASLRAVAMGHITWNQYMAVNKFGQDSKISALEFIKASGWPVYRLRTQLRMVKGQFELCKAVVNPDSDIGFKYGPGTEIDLPGHGIGRAFESFITSNYPDITPAAPGSLEPIFIHCPSASARVDPVTRSFQNNEQVKVALGFLCDFVNATKVDPGQILIIGPSTAMVAAIACIRNEPEYAALRTMPPAMTADSMQGHDGEEMVVAILGTHKRSGAGFLADERRISLMLSRHRSALLIVGNLTMVRTAEGDIATIKPKMLRKAQHMMCDAGRVIEIQYRRRLDVEGENGDDDDEGSEGGDDERGEGRCRSGDNESK